MSALPRIGLLVFASVTCGLVALGLLVRALRSTPSLPQRDTPWPWSIRSLSGLARLLGPWVRAVVAESRLKRLRAQLEATDLYPGINAADWLALRAIHAVLAAMTASAILAAVDALSAAAVCLCAVMGHLAGGIWLRRLIAENERRIVRELPPYLDLLTVCVEAGATLTAAARMIIEQAPPSPLRKYFERVLREVRGGRTRSQAFVSVAESYGVESLSTLASALAHAETAGMSIGSVLRSQSEQRNSERFMRAEKLAMEAPVKMLGPLIFCIFPCTFIVLAVPIAYKLVEVLRA
jgi:tight adherence protein C